MIKNDLISSLYPDWQSVQLTKVGYIMQREKAVKSITKAVNKHSSKMNWYRLIIRSWNVTTTVNVELTASEFKLIKYINKSLIKQKAENIIDAEAI